MEQSLNYLKDKYRKMKLSMSSRSQSSPFLHRLQLPPLFLVLHHPLHFINQPFLIFLIVHHLLITEMNLMNILIFHKYHLILILFPGGKLTKKNFQY
ncbi:hypothetical protein C1646_641087 [Rhizophagus diaphanus]|nr:hypothetical protein C1646_641087 [Rhizophagus diaphanus] [Rhizophagus sp. MUCL 43196]